MVRVKQRGLKNTMQKQDPRITKFLARPLSWSSLASFSYNKADWYDKYILGIQPEVTAPLIFGKTVGEKIASDPSYLTSVPRLKEHEHKLDVTIGKIPCIGFLDDFDLEGKCFNELKTGKMWSQKKAEAHGQIDLYAAMIYLKHNIKPEDLTISLIWLPTRTSRHNGVDFIKDMKPVIFPLKKTMRDILVMMAQVQRTHKEMQDYILSIPVDNVLAKN